MALANKREYHGKEGQLCSNFDNADNYNAVCNFSFIARFLAQLY